MGIAIIVVCMLYTGSMIMDWLKFRELEKQNRFLREEVRLLKYGSGDGLHG